MVKSTFTLVAAFAVLAGAVAYADCGNCDAKATGSAAASAGEACGSGACGVAQACAGKGCPIAAALERLPKLTYAVGEQKTCCPKEAAKLAKESGSPIHFCAAGKEYDKQSDAQTALIAATDKLIADFTTPHACPTSGQVTLAGLTQSCAKSAAQRAQRMKEAMAQVKLTYLVGDQKCNCPVQAGKIAKETGKDRFFVVGEEKTACEASARLNLARAKYKAAVTAMFEAEKQAASAATAESAQESKAS